MYYVANLSVPINTTTAAPMSAEILPVERTIKEVQIAWLTDPVAKVGVRLLDGSSKRVLPCTLSPGEWIISGQGTITIPADEIALSGSPYTISIQAYNLNSTGDAADVQVRVVVVNLTLFQAVQMVLTTIREAIEGPIAHLLKETRPS